MGKRKGPARSRELERFWRRIVSGQAGSGLTIAAWCGQQGVPASSFYAWRRELRKRAVERPSGLASLLPVEIIPCAESVGGLEIELPSHVKVRVRSGCDLELLRRVLTMLQPAEPEAPRC